MVALTVTVAGSLQANPQSAGCVWLTGELDAIQASVISGKLSTDETQGPHVITALNVVSVIGPQLPQPYTVAEASAITELHETEGCAG